MNVRVVESPGLLPRHLAGLKVVPPLRVGIVLAVDLYDSAFIPPAIVVPLHLVRDEPVGGDLAWRSITRPQSESVIGVGLVLDEHLAVPRAAFRALMLAICEDVPAAHACR